jgi:RHS repeat-associated protein
MAYEEYSYEADGNMLTDGWWTYTWDAENRFTSMTANANVPAESKRKLEFAYDYMGRRVQKKVYSWNVGTSAYQLSSTVKFIYDGWNVVAEIDGSNALIRNYIWGQDVSGSMQGAGGIGGLLLVNESTSSYQVGYDGNSNVVGLMKAGVGTFSATYEYDPFDNTLRSTGDYATQNSFSFSTKYADSETGLLYYGFRYYSPQIGRWISKDPMEEKGGINLYAYAFNNSPNLIDPFGKKTTVTIKTSGNKGIITVKASIAIWTKCKNGISIGDLAKAARTLEQSIEKAWSGTYTKDGITFTINVDVTVDNFGNDERAENGVWDTAREKGIQNIIEIVKGPVRILESKNGTKRTVPGETDHPATIWWWPDSARFSIEALESVMPPHEFGHLLGVNHREIEGNIMTAENIIKEIKVVDQYGNFLGYEYENKEATKATNLDYSWTFDGAINNHLWESRQNPIIRAFIPVGPPKDFESTREMGAQVYPR